MTPVEQLLAKLPSAKRNGRGWMARCPAHDDRQPSLAIAEGTDGRALVKCHAGCETADVLRAVGLELRDLMCDTSVTTTRTSRRKSESRAVVAATPQTLAKNTTTYTTAREAVNELERRYGPRSAHWTYHNAASSPVGVIVRWDRDGGKKDIRPVSLIGSEWVVGGMPVPRPLYRLSELADAQRVFITEGEKAAEAARLIGLIATTSPHGSESAGKTDWTPLAGKECVLLPDNDDAGRRYVDEVAGILAMLTPTAVIKIVELPDLPAGGDMADFVAREAAL